MKILDLEQGSKEWLDARIEKISGTRFADAIGTKLKQDTLINQLIAERLTGESKQLYQTDSMYLGTEAESHAIEEYEIETGEITEQAGLCVSDEFDWLVNSPDRLIQKEGKYRKAVEVKSPNPETAIKYIRANKIPKEYEAQVISYFLVNNDLNELDFVVYSPKFHNHYRLWIKNVKRSDLPITDSKEKLILFRQKWIETLRELNLEL